MKISPNRFPLFGGQVAIISFDDDELKFLKESSENPVKIQIELIGTHCYHSIDVKTEGDEYSFVVPANVSPESVNAKIRLEKQPHPHISSDDSNIKTFSSESDIKSQTLSKGEKSGSKSPEIRNQVEVKLSRKMSLCLTFKKMAIRDMRIEYFDDGIDDSIDQIVKTLKNATKLKDVIEKLCNSLAEHLNCEKSRENFDFKLSTLLRNRIKAENNDMKAHDFDSLSKVLVSHGLKITNKLFLHFLTHENYEVPDVDFGRAIDEINTKSVFRKSKFYTSSLEDISRISESKSENDIYIDQPPFMLQPIKEDAHIPSTSKGSDKENDKPSSDGSVKTNDVNETQITDSGGTQTSITITECYNETSSETFVDNRDFIRRSNTDDLAHPVKNGSNKAPSRSQSEKREKNEREPKLEECLDPESGISLNVPLHTSDNALVTKKVEPEIRMESKMENSESSTPASNTLDIIEKRSIDSDEILVDIKEFIQRQVEHVTKDTSFNINPIKTYDRETEKSTTSPLSRFFTKSKKQPKDKQTLKSNLQANKKPLCSSTVDLSRIKEGSVSTIDESLSPQESSHSTCNIAEETTEAFPEAETWSEIADPKLLKKLASKEVKRQDIIYEIIKSEFNYLKTLKTMYNVYYLGLLHELKIPPAKVDTLIPRITDLSAIHGTILANWRQLQIKSENLFIESIGDSLLFQFSEPLASNTIDVYSDICSNQVEARECYEELLNEKKFREFIESCRKIQYLRRLSIKECQTLIAQRMIKYPMLIERILSNTKESDKDHPKISKSLARCKEVLQTIDRNVKVRLNEKLLNSYKQKAEPKSEFITKKNVKYRLIDLLNDVLLQDSTQVRLKSRAKFYDVVLLTFDKYLLFICEMNAKFNLINIDHKNPILNFTDLVVRIAAADPNSLFIVDLKNADFYEIGFTSEKSCTSWMTSYNNANEHYKELSRTSGAEEKRQATLNEFFEFFNQLDQQVLRLVKLHSNLIEEIQNVYTYLKSQIGQADSNKTRRYSIFEPDILEKQVYNDLTGLFKIPPGSVAHSGTFKNKSVGSKRARNKTTTVATSKSAPKILKYAVDDDSNFHTTLDEIKDNVLVEINFIKSIRGILKRVEGRLSSNTSFEKFHNDICNVVNEVSQVAEAIEKILSDIQAQYKSFGDMIDKDHRIQINRRLSSLKIKIQELTNLGNLV